MKRLLLVLALALPATADDLVRVDLTGKPGVPAPVAENGKDGIARIHKIDQASLELYPTTNQPARGTLLICPGGGYAILAIEHEGRSIARRFNACGYDAAVLNYHVSEGDRTRAMALEDAKGALALLRKDGAKLGLKTTRIGVMGFSAGGHLAARLAHEAASAPPDFLVLMYPAYLEKSGELLEDVKPPRVPTFVYTAENDKFVTSARAFSAYCKAEGISCDLHLPSTGGHGFGLKETLPEGVRDWPEKLCEFLAR